MNVPSTKVIPRFPLNGYCKLTTMQVTAFLLLQLLFLLTSPATFSTDPLVTSPLQVLSTLLNAQFELKTSNGGGVEGQQFSEYLFLRFDQEKDT